MTDVRTLIEKYKNKCIQQYLNSTQSPWKNILEEMLKSVGGPNLIIHCNFSLEELHQKIPPFYIEVLKSWKLLKLTLPEDNANQFLWNNINIKIDHKTIFDRNCLNCGMWPRK
jgi:hypothetical protein